jgi:hypothetical protein
MWAATASCRRCDLKAFVPIIRNEETIMHRKHKWTLAAFGLLLAASTAVAQQPQNVRVRGTIEKVDGDRYLVKARDGSDVTVKLSDKTSIRGITKMSLSDVKPGSYVGAAAMPQADGTQKAIEVHIFPEAMRGTGDGHRPFDLGPQSTMTNGNVDQTVAGVDGQVLTVKYKDGEKKIIVTPDTPVVTYVPAEKAELKPGAKIIVNNGTKEADGSVMAASISVGLNGLTPPM